MLLPVRTSAEQSEGKQLPINTAEWLLFGKSQCNHTAKYSFTTGDQNTAKRTME
jgi:hypothetical protein